LSILLEVMSVFEIIRTIKTNTILGLRTHQPGSAGETSIPHKGNYEGEKNERT